MLAAKF